MNGYNGLSPCNRENSIIADLMYKSYYRHGGIRLEQLPM